MSSVRADSSIAAKGATRAPRDAPRRKSFWRAFTSAGAGDYPHDRTTAHALTRSADGPAPRETTMKNAKKPSKTLKLTIETVKNLSVRSELKAGAIHSNAIVQCTSGVRQQQ